MLLLVTAACHELPITHPKDADADTDADADSDADADADTDADTDSAHTGTPTGETGTAACVGLPNELELFVEPRDNLGVVCAICAPGALDLYAGFRNPCAVDITIDAVADCLVTSFEVQYPGGPALAGDMGCDGAPVPTTIPAGGALESKYQVLDADMLGAYTLTASLNTSPQTQTVSGGFTVQ
ncbi:MAG: hypothetical protein ABMA64_11210 [Myxococcota bacterium]